MVSVEWVESPFRVLSLAPDNLNPSCNPPPLSILSSYQVLRDMEENPAAAQKHLANVQVAAKFEKLVEAGIVQIR